jgi:hypothetical protein
LGESEQTSLTSNLHRIDYRDLGYWPQNLIDANSSKITSLITDPKGGLVFGATSGARAHLFCFSPSRDHVRPLGFLPKGNGVKKALALGADGMLYAGTGKDMTLPAQLSEDWGSELGSDHIHKKMWADLQAEYANYNQGRIYRFDPNRWSRMTYHADKEAEVEDLGAPVAGEGIYCMIASADGNTLYGISYPKGHFFIFDLASRETSILGPVWDEVIYAGPKKGERSLPGDLILDDEGYCYFSVDRGRLARYNPESGEIEKLSVRLPGEYYLFLSELEAFHPVVESWTLGADGSLFGGTNDGFLFRFFPQDQRLTNLGKARITRRIRTLTTGDDGRIWGTAGEDRIGCTFFVYDPAEGSYHHLGHVSVDRSPYYAWNPHRFGASATGLDGTIYLGESDRKGHLYFVLPVGRPKSEPDIQYAVSKKDPKNK